MNRRKLKNKKIYDAGFTDGEDTGYRRGIQANEAQYPIGFADGVANNANAKAEYERGFNDGYVECYKRNV